MWTITTSKGAELSALGITPMKVREKTQLIISLEPGAEMAEAAGKLEGLEWMRAKGAIEGASTTYEGYNRIATMRRVEDGSLQVTLTREG